MSDPVILVLTTCPTKLLAEEILNACLESRLVACGQIGGPVTSRYRWQGKLEESTEFVLSLKTRRSLFSRVEEKVKEFHDYEVPEILSFSVDQGAASYLDWVVRETQ